MMLNGVTRWPVCLFAISLLLAVGNSAVSAQAIQLDYKAAPVDNPLKGLVPYWGQAGPFPCSLEFWYFPISEIMVGRNEFDWVSVEKKLEDCRGRGNQMVIRMYLEFPGKKTAVPEFLITDAVKISRYKYDGKLNLTPDYHDPKLLKAMENFIAAFGKKYDGDPRVGFITMGVLGHWGEWHTFPKGKLFATKPEQTRIQDAFAKAFKRTKVLMRYPAGKETWAHAPNDEYPFGYHDDSFAWATLDTGKEEDEWFFETSMKKSGTKAVEKWQTQPIGGEIRPEIWGCVFDDESCVPKGQEFGLAVSRMHVSWLMDSGMFALADPAPTKQRIANATKQVQKMGYELYVKQANIEKTADELTLQLELENRGVAPFYYDWPVEIVLIKPDGSIASSHKTDWRLSQTLPGREIQWRTSIGLPAVELRIGIRVVNPMDGGKPLRFANRTQQKHGVLLIK